MLRDPPDHEGHRLLRSKSELARCQSHADDESPRLPAPTPISYICKPSSSPNTASSNSHDVDRPAIGPNDVLVRVAACGICGSDVHGYDGSSGRRIPPIVMGHEAAGAIAEVGARRRSSAGRRPRHVRFHHLLRPVRRLPHAARSICAPTAACSASPATTIASTARSPSSSPCRRHILYPLPAELPFEHAALIEPVSVARARRRSAARFKHGERAVVVGSGMIGLLVIQALRVAGCGEVIAIDIDDGRLELATELGATDTINAQANRRRRRGHWNAPAAQGADVAVEVVGNAAGTGHGDRLRPPRRPRRPRRQPRRPKCRSRCKPSSRAS